MAYHGEASSLPWTATVLSNTPDEARVRFAVRLFRSPFRLERTMSVRAGSPVLTLDERVTNEGAEPLAAMWSHHPAFGAPFLSPALLIDTDARTVWADLEYDTPGGRVQPGGRWSWPAAAARDGTPVDLSRLPAGDKGGDLLTYLGDFAEGWYALTNPALGFGVALVWTASVLPYAWLWQELHSSTGFPWYGAAYTMAIEPASSVPGHGLVTAMEQTGSHLTLAAGESRTLTLRVAFYEAGPGHGVVHVAPDGAVRLRDRS
jgi:galactose mutarotase-like enzyme